VIANEATAGGWGGSDPATLIDVNEPFVGVPSQLMPSRTMRQPQPKVPAVDGATPLMVNVLLWPGAIASLAVK